MRHTEPRLLDANDTLFRGPPMHRSKLAVICAALVGVMGASPAAHAGKAWDEIRAGVFGTRAIEPAGELVHLTAPTRPKNQSAVPIEVEAAFADGRTVRAVTIVVDENPSPSPPCSTSAASATA